MDLFEKITFVGFCLTSASMLQEDLGLPTEKLICLYKECIEMAKYCNDIDTMNTFVRFCYASATVLRKDLGLPTEKLICLYKECIEMAKYYNDIGTMVYSCKRFVLHSNSIGRHADSLRCLKEILPSAAAMSSYELIVRHYLTVTYKMLKDFDNVVLHATKLVEIARKIGDKEKEIHGHNEMGRALSALARYDDAIGCYKRSLEIAKEIDSTKGQMMAHNRIMYAYKGMQKYDDTILYAHKLLDCAKKTNDQQAMMTAYLELGTAHLALDHHQDAIDYGKKCIEIARKIEDRRGEVCAYILMGQVYKALSDCDKAIIYCKKYLELAIIIGEKRPEAHAYSILGEMYHSLGKYEDAIFNCNKYLHIDKEENEDKAADIMAYLTLGNVNKSLEKYDEAIQNFKQCIDFVNCIGREKKAGASACMHLGEIYKKLEKYDDAVHYFNKCVDMSQETGDKITEMKGHYLLAEVYMESLQLNDVSLSIDAGMAIATELGDNKAEENFKVIRSALYATVGLLDKACDVPSIAELIEMPTCSEDDLVDDLAKAKRAGDNEEKYAASIRLYRFYASNKDYEKAKNCLEQLKEMDIDPCANLFCFTQLGLLYQTMGKTDMALRCYEEGLTTAESCSNTMHRPQFYSGFGEVLFLSNRELNLAERYLREAIRCFEAIFMTLGSRDEFKISIFDKCIHSYKLLAILLIKTKQVVDALLVLDRFRARALKDLMMTNYKMEQKGSNDKHLEHSDVLSLVSSNDFSISYYSLCSNAFLNFFLVKTCLNFYLHSKEISTNDFLRIYVDRLFDEMGVGEGVNCEDRSLDKQQDIQREQNRNEEEYETLNQTTASLLNLDSRRGESNEDSVKTKGSTLEVLFGILQCDRILSSKQDEVVIIPDGPLYQVPFPALQDPSTGKYLSETKRIRLAPSLATLKYLEDFPTDQTSNAKPLIIGGPLVGNVMMDGEEQDIGLLFGALDEAIDIAALLGVSPLVAANATKPAVLEKLRERVSVVHIAAHGILSKATVVLAPSDEIRETKPIPDEEDYMLTMADVQQAKVRAQLVVLSCCHSGRGEIRAEGVVSGMCRAFLASGARAVVASLWAIDDKATLEFMHKFYLSLKDGKSASASLQQAMNEMRNTTNYSRPKYWAPFFLMGDDVTLQL